MKYCISDIHGCSKTLLALLAKLQLTHDDTVYFLGDYVDRGPDSKGVLDIVMGMPNAICHKGNHEDMMLKALGRTLPSYAGNFFEHWMVNGGQKALDSFGGPADAKYLDFMESLTLITELPDFYLCHAGISHKPMKTPEEVLLWDRECGVNLERTGGRRLVCGHTPTVIEEVEEDVVLANKVVIDGGCIFTQYEGLGNLLALRLDDMKLFAQRNIDVIGH